MKKWLCVITVTFFLTLFVLPLIGIDYEVVKADDSFSLELNEQCTDLSETFLDNQREANRITSRLFAFLNKLYGTSISDSEYSVNGIVAENFPPYFAGTYINTEGHLVIQIVDEFYSPNYKESAWYQEIVEIVKSENFYCNPVKYSYADLINALSEVSIGNLYKEFDAVGIVDFDAGINDYQNCIRITLHSQDDYDAVIGKLSSDIYSVSVVRGEAKYSVAVNPGQGIHTSNTGGYGFSAACRVKRYYPDGSYEYGFLTCAHAFSGTSNVYVYTGVNINTFVGISYSFNQKLGGKVDVAYVASNENVTLGNVVNGYSTVLNPSYPSSMGSVVYKYGANSGETYGIIMDSSHSTIIEGIQHFDIVQAAYYADFGDSGGIVCETPDSTNHAYIDGIHSAIFEDTDTVLWSYFTKIYNDLAALQSGPVYFNLY